MQSVIGAEAEDIHWMQKALALARRAEKFGEVPVGAVIIKNNQMISSAYNRKESLPSALGHAELIAIHKAAQKLKAWRLIDCTLYVTLEPCCMCAGAIIQSRIKRVVYATPDPKAGACGSIMALHQHPSLNHHFLTTSRVLADEASLLLKEFFKKRRLK